MSITPADPTRTDGPFCYTSRGHLLSPSGIVTNEITHLDRGCAIVGFFGGCAAGIAMSMNDFYSPVFTFLFVSALMMTVMFGLRVWRHVEVTRDVREFGYPDTDTYLRAANHFKATGTLLL